jgi:uncharacterized protein involved in outer membrane biogenesis
MKRALAIGLGLLALLPFLVVGGFLLFFDADAFRPRLAEAVQRATGREFRIEGGLHLTPALTPTLKAEGLVLANLPGGSAPEMLRIAEAELRLALLPLLSGRIELAHLRLEGGRLLLERENWRFARPAAEPAPATPATPSAPSRPMALDLRAVTLRDWQVTAQGETLNLPELRLTGSGPGQPLDLAASLVLRGAEARIEGRVGAPDAFAGPAPWPFRLAATLPGARLTAEGQQANGDWTALLTAEIPRLEALATLAGRGLPPLAGITLRAEASVTAGVAQLSNLQGQVAGGEMDGLTLTAARFTQPSLEAPLAVQASGSFRGEALNLAGEVMPMALATGSPAPLSLRLAAGGATASLAGEWPGALRLTAAAPELERLSVLAGRPLPPLREATLNAAFTALGPLFSEGARIGEFAMASSGGDLAGVLEWRWAPRLAVVGRLTSTRLDLDALRLPAVPPAPPAAPTTTPAAPPPPPAGRVIPDRPIDLAALRVLDAELTFALAEVIEGGRTLRAVEGRLVNAGGQARLEPFAATLPGGRLSLALAADATGATPALEIRGGGQGLDPVALLGVVGLSSPLTGRTDIDVNLRGAGATWRAVAASATGHLGLAVTEGRLSGGPAQALAQIPGFAGGVPVACLALRGEADRGLVRFTAFYLDGAAGRLAGEGGMSLRDETLAIRMQGDLRLAGVRVRAPIPLGGTLAAPRLELSALTEGAVGSLLGAPSAGGVAMPDCAGALRVARGGREGPVPSPAPAPTGGQAAPAINNLLRGLLGR